MKIQNFVFTWNQYTDSAIKHENNLTKFGKTIVINSNINFKKNHWINLNDAYFSEQWNTLISNIDSDTDFVFHIQSDATVNDYNKLYSRFYEIVSKYDVGIYTTNIDYTWHKYNINLLKKLEENLYEIPNTDCTFWIINTKIIDKKPLFDLKTNRLGHGGDWYYSAKCKLNNKLVVRDYDIILKHPSHRNYDTNEAGDSLFMWLKEQPLEIKEKIEELMSFHSKVRIV
jgi:hypothetical protein